MKVWDILGTTACRKIEKKKDKNRDWPTKIIGNIEQKKCATFAGNAFYNLIRLRKIYCKVKIIFKHKYI